MSPKKALLILSAILLVGGGFFALLYRTAHPKVKLQEGAVSDQVPETREGLIRQKIDEKFRQLDAKPQEVLKKEGYTQEELDFIANPRQEAIKELNLAATSTVATSSRPKIYTQEELDAIANPSK